MKALLCVVVFFPLMCSAQFGFEQDITNSNIEVIKDGIAQKYPWAGGLDYCHYSNIDLDLDGVDDLFIFDKTCNKILTFLQKGTTGVSDFEYAPEYEKVFESITPALYGWVLLVDYDGDGRNDIFSSAPGGGIVYRNVSTVSSGLSFELETTSLPSTLTYNGNTQASAVYASQADIPAIVDVDGDGDLDVLAFYLGSCVRYYKNLCQETYGHSDSLFFKTVNVCYGNFEEANSTNVINLNTCCSQQPDNPESVTAPERPVIDNQDRHAGSTLLGLDLDADHMTDLIIGDISYNTLTMLMNGGTAPNTNVSMVSQDNNYPSYDTPVDLPIFPGAFYVDVNNDEIRDLLVSPNSTTGANNFNGNWYYKNTGQDNFPDFEFQQDDFLQGNMIDYGTGALPVLFDHNGDGLKDLLVSIKAKYDETNGNYESKIAYYENTGTATNPQFTFVTDDYQNLSSLNGGSNLYFYPTFGDLDGDGDEEMLLGEYDGDIMIFDNIAGSGNPAVFSNGAVLTDNLGATINEGLLIVPKLVDMDRDGALDLVLGKRNGKLSYYRNTGNLTNYSFTLQTTTFGGVDVSEYWTIEGMAVPEFIDIESTYHLVIGSKSGYLHYYDDIEGNLNGNFDLVDSTLEDIYTGQYSAPAIADLDGDDKLEMILGNQRGGVGLFESVDIATIGLEELDIELNIYPNPAQKQFTIDLSQSSIQLYKKGQYSLIDITGRQVFSSNINHSQTVVDCSNLSSGIYILKIDLGSKQITRKMIIESF